MFRRAPVFYSGILLTLALGIGANGAVFGILRAVLLQPLPYRDANRVVMVWQSPQHPPVGQQNEMLQGHAWMRGFLTPQMVTGWRHDATDVLADMAAIISWQGNLDTQFDRAPGDRAECLRGALVTPNFFDLLGVQAARGRVFTGSDAQSSEPIIVISDALWRSAFGADPDIIGRRVTLIAGIPRGPRAYTVVGVLPAAFRFTCPQETEIWSPVSWAALVRRRPFMRAPRA